MQRWCIARSVRMRRRSAFVASVTILSILALVASVDAQARRTNGPQRGSPNTSGNPAIPPPPPQNVNATLTANESTAFVTWDPVEGHIDKFLVKIRCHDRVVKCCGSCDSNHTAEGNETEIAFEVDSATRYDIQVAASLGDIVGNYSSKVSIETKATAPRRPEITPKITNTSVTLNWNYTCPYTGPVEYQVKIGEEQSGVLKSESEDGCMYSFTTTELQPFTDIPYSFLAEKPSCQAECKGISNQREQTTTFRGDFDETSVPSDEAEDASDITDDIESLTPSISSVVTNSRSFTTTNYEGTSERTDNLSKNEDLPCPHICISDSVKTLPNVAGKPELHIRWPDFKTDTKTTIRYDFVPSSSVTVKSYNISVTVGNKTEYCDTSGPRSSSCVICPKCSISTKEAYFENTKINTTYSIEVRAMNSFTSEYGPPAVKSHTTGIGWPVIKRNPVEYWSRTELHNYALYKVFPIKVWRNAIDDSHGPITLFQILLSDQGCQGKDVHGYFTKPDDDDHSKTFKGDVKYQNSSVPPEFKFDNLESSTNYFFKFRIYSYENFTDSMCYSFITDSNYVRDNAINISLVVIVLLFVTCIALIIYRRLYSPVLKSGDAMELPLLLMPVVDEDLSKPIRLSNISDRVQHLMADDQTELKMEYDELGKKCLSKPTTVANNPLNRSKNRYINILPFDETRVILNEYRGIPQSDYYNASYIHGYEKPKEFIACQGPREHEKDTFWRMIWEKNVHVIVMVTKCVESKMEKCSKYWPDASGSDLNLSMSELRVRTLKETPHTEEGYICRTIKLSKQSLIPIPKPRIIQQFHYMLWPDMGCPKNPDHLIHFTNVVKKAIPPKTRTVVHCSAGVGRTGTFIALCNLQEEMKAKNTVDVFQAVYRMRQNRVNMVQTLVQYGFLYKCVQRWEEMQSSNHKLDQVLIHDNIPDVITTTFSALNASDMEDDPYQPEETSRNSELILDNLNKSASLIELESMTDEGSLEQDFTEIPEDDATSKQGEIPEDDATSKQGDVTTNGDGEAAKDYETTKGDGEATKDYETTKGDGEATEDYETTITKGGGATTRDDATTKDSDLTAMNDCQGDSLK
ncbi:receptor-type tyrosine-protein phosphatase eta-like isoform X2 [Macrobrachium nipponense]|uniref:receptor-type tyrosine-protein phosphatase eta-like isoform X2 n=1 Tax=Macrobrachium nipponense TaxID=159736 RepID=UPI0030C82604